MSDVASLIASVLSQLDAFRLGLILITIFLAGIVKGAIGFGFPLMSIPLISTVWDPKHAVLLVSLASLFNNVGVAVSGRGSRETFRRFLPVLIGMTLGTGLGALLLASVPSSVLAVVVGTAALAFATVALLKPDLAVPSHLERYLALPMGFLGGVLGGSTGIAGPFVVSYTHALKLSKREFVYFLSVLYLLGAIVQFVSYTQLGLFDALTFGVGLASCVPNFLGVALGFRIQDRIDPLLFRKIVVVVIALSGASLMMRVIWG
jgi:uncharacterized membrane protein YfcA